jgi:uncharacterized UBP type Zn finger protein
MFVYFIFIDQILTQSFLLQEEDEATDRDLNPPPHYYIKGLKNRGNSCYLNALLQFVASSTRLTSPDFAERLRALDKVGPALAEVVEGINDLDNQRQSLDPSALITHLAAKNAAMDGRKQQDSHEALMLLLDLLDTEFKALQESSGGSSGRIPCVM